MPTHVDDHEAFTAGILIAYVLEAHAGGEHV